MKNNLWPRLFLLIIISLPIFLSFWSLTRFPPLNIEETGITIMANTWLQTGRIFNPIQIDIGHPHYSEMAGATHYAIRGGLILIIGLVQKILGPSLFSLRFFSLLIWIFAGLLLFTLSKSKLGMPPAVLTIIIWFTSFDGTLAAHLVRPDILIAFGLVLTLVLMEREENSLSPINATLIGFLAGLSPGIHAHGLLIGLTILILTVLKSIGKNSKSPLQLKFIFYGFFLGLMLWFYCNDYPTFALHTQTLDMQITETLSKVWVHRLNPLTLIADSFLLWIKPQSFYVGEAHRIFPIWNAGFLFLLLSFIFSSIWVWLNPQSPPFLKRLTILLIFTFFAIGYGHLRKAVIYNLPVTILGIPILSWCLTDLVKSFKTFRLTGGEFILVGLVLLFPFNISFFIVLMLIFLSREKLTDRSIIFFGIGGMLVVFSLYLRDSGFLRKLPQTSLEINPAFPFLFFMGLICIGIGLILIFTHRKNYNFSSRESLNKLKFSLLSLFILTSSSSTIAHELSIGLKNIPMSQVWKYAAQILPQNKNLRVAGPQFFWFYYQSSFRSIGSVIYDFYMTGQKRPREHINRYKPNVLVLNEGFIKKFMTQWDPEKKQYKLLPIQSISSAPISLLGTLGPNLHHGTLYLFKLDWTCK